MNPVRTGSYTGTGAAINIPLGFIPDMVEVFNETDGNMSWRWIAGMTNGHALQSNATGDQSRITSNGISAFPGVAALTPAGFTIGTALSTSGKTFRWCATRALD